MSTLDRFVTVHPAAATSAAVWRLVILEFWERFSYYGVLSILVLFLTSSPNAGGFGWTDSRALDLLAKFTALAFVLPMLGGYVADRWLGPRRAVLSGSCLLVTGNATIAIAARWPAIDAFGQDPALAAPVLAAGIGCIALGNGLFKSSLITLIGSLVAHDEAVRERTFRYYYQAIMLGALLSALCVGGLAETLGWWSGFALAALGMTISWVMFLLWRMPEGAPAAASRPLQAEPAHERGALTGSVGRIAVFCLFLPIISIGWVQFQGLWLIQAERWSERTLAGFTVPTPWLLALNGIGIVVLVPWVGRVSQRWRQQGRAPGFATQFVLAFLIMGAANLLMAWAFRDPSPASVSLLWPASAILIITLAEALWWPSSYNALHKLAPAHLKSMLMGLWLAMLGIGQFLAHQIARSAELLGFATLSAAIGAALCVAGLALWYISRAHPDLRKV